MIDRHVQEMLDAGMIKEGNGPWGFPVVLVCKKDGSVRFCVDFRALNAVTVKDVYPLPRIDDTLEAMGGAMRFTTLDLMAGYWQIGLNEQDQDKAAFVTRNGLFKFVRMPFGLSNAPSTFQRLMDCVLRGLLWVCCLVYLDDIIVFSRGGIERHAVEVATVLARLEDAGLTVKLKTAKELRGRLHRWALALQVYRLEIVYRPGRENVVPDALSRAPVRHVLGSELDGSDGGTVRADHLQVDDELIKRHQGRSRLCITATSQGSIEGKPVRKLHDKVMVFTEDGWKTLLPPSVVGGA